MVREEKGTRLGKYELGRTLGVGNFGKVKYAKHVESRREFAVKILDKKKIVELKVTNQVKREIETVKLLKHPNIVRLHEVIASKTKIYMILEYVTGGELFKKIERRGRLNEIKGRKLFQQLIDAVSYCHDIGVYHRDLKPENVLVDAGGNVKISDFGLSALPQHVREDGLLHTTCGSPNYVAPEVLANRGYNGATSDIWSCGVILYVILSGHLPFDDRNMVVLYQKIFRGEVHMPKWLSPGAKKLIKRILDPNPATRISMAEIKADEWFKQEYSPISPNEEDDECIDGKQFSVELAKSTEIEPQRDAPTLINAFELIGMSSSLDLSGFFEKEHASQRKIMFTSNQCSRDLNSRIGDVATMMGFSVEKKYGKLKVTQELRDLKSSVRLSVTAEVFAISPSLHVVELRRTSGDASLYRQLYKQLLDDLAAPHNPYILTMDV